MNLKLIRRWEYKIDPVIEISGPSPVYMEQLGEQGWELVCIFPGNHYSCPKLLYKREV